MTYCFPEGKWKHLQVQKDFSVIFQNNELLCISEYSVKILFYMIYIDLSRILEIGVLTSCAILSPES